MLRRLPILLPPVRNETNQSYLKRLATINHVPREEVENLVTIGKHTGPYPRRRPLDPAKLASLTGYQPDRLLNALPDLTRTLRARSMQPTTRPACPRCTRRHRGGVVRIYLSRHRHVCLRHNLWLGSLGPENPRHATPDGPVDIHPLPAVRAAQRRHHRLVHRYGHTATAQAVTTAVDIWDRMHKPDYLGRHDWARIWTLRPGTTWISLDDPLSHAVRYPEILTIASVLISPTWQTIAAHTRESAFDEIGRRVSHTDYSWRPWKQHPLTYWADNHEQQRRPKEAHHSTLAKYIETTART